MSVTAGHLDARTEEYVHEVVRAIDMHVPVVEAYLVGSGAAGGFDPRTSDVDVVVVVERTLGSERQPIVDAIRALHLPVRDLELVVYVAGAQPPSFELNLNHGREEEAEPFWFVLDAALAEAHAVPLLRGTPWPQVFEPVTEERVREAALASLEWSERRNDEFGRVNAIRTRHYLEHGEWLSKTEAAE